MPRQQWLGLQLDVSQLAIGPSLAVDRDGDLGMGPEIIPNRPQGYS